MFEDSLVASQIARTSQTKRWTIAGSMAVQSALALLLCALPLLHPEHLSFHESAPLVFTPPPPSPPIRVQQVEQAAVNDATASVPAIPTTLVPIISRTPGGSIEQEPDFHPLNIGNSMTSALPDAIGRPDGRGTSVTVAPTPPPATPRSVSSGVMAGMLLAPIQPVYPAIAKAAGISGTVVVEAIISKTGSIESLQVVSGPQMLRKAAIDAIRGARYRPFRLNDAPIEVQTTITVNFRLGA
jgi:periplasmic protein TonB